MGTGLAILAESGNECQAWHGDRVYSDTLGVVCGNK